MPCPRGLSYLAKNTKSYKPIGRAGNLKSRAWKKVAFLWGDPMFVISMDQDQCTVSAKGHILEVPRADLTDKPILQLYQVDCGQGDATFIHFPDGDWGRWMIIDGGPPRGLSNSGKIAADFLYWKIFVDFSWRKQYCVGPRPFHIQDVVCTHPDRDHYGGLMDLTDKIAENDQNERITLGTVYHNGLGRFDGRCSRLANGEGHSQLGPVKGSPPEAWLTTLIDSFHDVEKYTNTTNRRQWKLTGRYATWLNDLRSHEGNGVAKLKALHYGFNSGYMPGFGPQSELARIRILGPVQESYRNSPALRYLDTAGQSSMEKPSKTRNGLSVVLRVDYGSARLLLTGDLNFRSQALLLRHVPLQEFECDVAKACHHGSEDISWKFLRTMNPTAVLISSGDGERYTHPRAKVLGWSGAFARKLSKGGEKKFLGLKEDNYISPLVYSTELSRSVELWDAYKVYDRHGNEVCNAELKAHGRNHADKGPRAPLNRWLLANRLVYGLINVRTDGRKVVVGVLKEETCEFQTEEFSVC